MNCPNCQSSDTIKQGFRRNGAQGYSCKSCGRRFTGNRTGRPVEPAGSCPKCGSSDTKKIGHRDPTKKRIYCHGCKKSTVLGSTKPASPKPDDEAQDRDLSI